MRESEGGLCAILRGVLLIDFEEVLGLWGGAAEFPFKASFGLGRLPKHIHITRTNANQTSANIRIHEQIQAKTNKTNANT